MDSALFQATTELSRRGTEALDRGMAAVRRLGPRGSLGRLSQIVQIVKAIDASIGLTATERSYRIGEVVRASDLADDELLGLVEATRGDGVVVRNALANVMPAAMRGSLYRRPIPGSAPVSLVADIGREIGSRPGPSRTGGNDAPKRSEYHAVVLLGTEEEHRSNSTLLDSSGFVPLPVRRPDALEDGLIATACGLVVGGTWWSQLTGDAHQAEVRRILGLSSEIWLRVDTEQLHPGAATSLLELAGDIRGDRPTSDMFCFGAGCQLTAADISSLDRVASRLKSSCATTFLPAELRAVETRVLQAAIAGHAAFRHARGEGAVGSIYVRSIPGGRSGARLLYVRPDDGGLPFVVKIDAVGTLRLELSNYNRYVKALDDGLRPRLHFTGSAGVLVYDVVPTADDPVQLAATLDERLELLANSELGSFSGPVPPKADDLTKAISRTVGKLERLNGNAAADGASDYTWIPKTIESMAERGICWTIRDSNGKAIDVIGLARRASARVQQLCGAAVSHGDMHLRNVLLCDDRLPFLIDYAYTGPGNPCYDIARLESAILYKYFRTTEREEDIAELFSGILSGTGADSLQAAFPRAHAPSCNCVAMEAAVACRSAGMRLAEKYGGNAFDYSAAKALIACQALTMVDVQASIVRASVIALDRLVA